MQLFVLTEHCKLRVHCRVCRNLEGGRKWRESLQKIFELPEDKVDFTCPYGMEWDSEVPPLPPEPEEKSSSKPGGCRTCGDKPRDNTTRVNKKGCGCSRSG